MFLLTPAHAGGIDEGDMHPRTEIRDRAADAGHRVDDLPIGRTQTYKLIAEGKLVAKKMGRATIILNWQEYLTSLPTLQTKALAG